MVLINLSGEVQMAARKSSRKSSGRKYSKKASSTVGSAMRRRKHGTLKTRGGRKVTSRKQAIAIGMSEAREKGEKVPRKRAAKSAAKKTSSQVSRADQQSAEIFGAKVVSPEVSAQGNSTQGGTEIRAQIFQLLTGRTEARHIGQSTGEAVQSASLFALVR